MSRVEFARARRRAIIARNPTQIAVHRVEMPVKGGGRDRVESYPGPFTVRIYPLRPMTVQEPASLAGRQQQDRDWSLIADETADLRSGPWVTDEFDVAGLGHFRITDVHPQMVAGQVVGYAAVLEKIS